jgi:sortase A
VSDESRPTSTGSEARANRKRRRPSFVSVFGELLLTTGVVVLLFVAWELWIGDPILGAVDNQASAKQSEVWEREPPPTPPKPEVNDDGEIYYEPVIAARPEGTEVFGNIIIPRFGEDYSRAVAGGTTRAGTLDKRRYGLYNQSVMPGEVGNFAVAAHRTTYGAALRHIDKLQLGDAIIIETKDGWYLYRFRSIEYVKPSRVQVLAEVPQMPGVHTGERYITMTACSPLYSLAERIVAYGVFETFQPRSAGAPAWLAETSA